MTTWNVIHRDCVISTMDEVDLLGEAGSPSGTVIVANEQTGGRGRVGRSWIAPAGGGLFLSMLYRPDLAAAMMTSLPLPIGVAVAEAVDELSSAACQLKWPNDVLIDGRKIAGILVTSKLDQDRVRFLNIGIGVNCTTAEPDLPAGAASILTATGTTVQPDDLMPVLLSRLAAALSNFERSEGRPSLDFWWARAAFRGERVRVASNGTEREGLINGVEADGALLLRDDLGNVHRIVSGDLTRGPRVLRAR